MMNDKDDDQRFTDLLSGYSTPAPDDGFSKSVLRTIEKQNARAKSWRFVVPGAAFVGGAIAATQVGALIDLIKTGALDFDPGGVVLLDISSLSPDYWLVGAVSVVFVTLSLAYSVFESEFL